MKTLLMILTLLAPAVEARVVAFKRDVSVDDVEATLRAQGFDVKYTECNGSYDCKMVLSDSETKDPLPIINAAKSNAQTASEAKAARAALADELAAIEAKLDDGTATAAEVRRAVKIILKLAGLARKP